jgi:RecB family exonuclease
MPLSILCGPFQPSLEKAFLDRLTTKPPSLERRVAVVAPSGRLWNRLQKLAVREGGLSLLNIRFHTFHSLALEVAEDVDWSDYTLVSDELFHDKVVDQLLEETDEGAPSVHSFRNLASAFRSSLKDLMEAGIDPVHFREHFPDLLKDESDRAVFGRLLDMQERYLSRLEELGVLPLTGLVQRVARHIEEGKPCRLSRYAEIFYYGFYDLNGVQSDFFQAVAQAFPVTLFFPYRKDHPGYRFMDRFFQLKLHSSGASPAHLPASVDDRALNIVLDALFDPSKSFSLPKESGGEPEIIRHDMSELMAEKEASEAPSSRPSPRLKVVNVSGARDEVWKVAKTILSLTAGSEGLDLGDIGVVARTLEPYRALIGEIFQENAIPHFLGAGEPLLRYPVAEVCWEFLTLRKRDYPVRSVLDVIESPYFRSYGFQGLSVGAQLVVHWKTLVHRLGIQGGWAQWRGKLAPWTKRDFSYGRAGDAGGGDGLIPKEDVAALWLFLEETQRRLDPSRERRGWLPMVEHARTTLQEYFDVPLQGADAEAWVKTLEALESLKVFDRLNPAASWGEFLDVLEEKLRRTVLDPGEDTAGVRVLDAMDARGESFKILFLIGLKEGLFPRPIREDPLLRDSVRTQLQDAAGYWILPKAAGYEEERLLFTTLVSSASERVYCLYPRSDENGRTEVPSAYLRELCRAAGLDLESADAERVPRPPYAKLESVPPEVLSPKEVSLILARDREEPMLFFDPLGLDSISLKEALRRMTELNRFGDPGPMDGFIGHPADFLESLMRRGLSPRALDKLAACPFQFYLRYVVGLDPSEPAADRGALTPLAQGDIYHRVLNRFYKELWDTRYWSNSAPPLWNVLLDHAVDEMFDQTTWSEMGVYPLVWYAAKQRMTEALRRFVDRDIAVIRQNGLLPVYFEQTYSAPAPLGVEGLRFTGRPDRLDWDPQRKKYRVVDYKTRWRGKSIEDLALEGKAHQLPLYLEITSNSPPFSTSRSEPVGAAYYVIEADVEGGEKWMHEFSSQAWAALREAVLKNIGGLYQRIVKGQFFIAPGEGRDGPCPRCLFARACRKAHPATRRRAEAFAAALPAPALPSQAADKGKKE